MPAAGRLQARDGDPGGGTLPSLGFLSVPDSGNSFSASLTVYYKYYEPSG